MTVSTLDLPRELVEREAHEVDYWYEDLDEEVGRILGQRKKKHDDESEADNDE